MKIKEYELIKKVVDLIKSTNPDNIEIGDYTNSLELKLIYNRVKIRGEKE